MMKGIIKIMAGVAFTTTLLIGVASCSNDSDDPQPDENTSSYLKEGNDVRPSWTTPDNLYKDFEFTMSVQVIPQDELLPYLSDDDLMCAVINDEMRAVANMQRTGGEPYFPLLIAGNSASGSVTLKYFCSKLKRIYTISDWMEFTPGISPMKDGKPYSIKFFP